MADLEKYLEELREDVGILQEDEFEVLDEIYGMVNDGVIDLDIVADTILSVEPEIYTTESFVEELSFRLEIFRKIAQQRENTDGTQQDQRDQERISSGTSQDGARRKIAQEREITEAEQRATEARLELESENIGDFLYAFEDLDAELQLPIFEKAKQNNEPVQLSLSFDQVVEVIKEQPEPKQKSLFDLKRK